VPEIKLVSKPNLSGVNSSDTSLSPSLFSGHELPVKNNAPVIHFTNYDYAVALILFISFCTFVWLYVSNQKKLGQLIRGFYLNRSGNQLSRDEYSVSNRVGFLLSLLFLFTIPLFAGQVVEYYGINVKMERTSMYIALVIGLCAMYFLKYLSIRLSGFIFKVGKEALDYSSAMFVFINILGLFMLPVVICMEFVKQVNPQIFIYTGCFFIFGFLCMRVLRGIVIGAASNRVSKFYLFLYLCTLEIVPFVIMVKLLMLYTA
jgi:hypothetical protein